MKYLKIGYFLVSYLQNLLVGTRFSLGLKIPHYWNKVFLITLPNFPQSMRFFFLLFHSKNTYIYLFIQLHSAFLKILFSYYLFLAVLGLHCCPQASSSCREQWLLLLVVCRLLLLQRTSSRHVSFSNCSPHVQSLWLRALADPQHVKSSATRDQTHVLCSSRWILVYYITREVQEGFILKQDSVHIIKKVLLWRRP